jgi:tetratricopeptide (TPR) repeat protein
LYNLALCFFKENNFINAEKKLRQLLNKFSDIDDKLTNLARYLLADVLLNLNQQYFNQRGKNKSNYLKRVEKLLKKAEKFEFSQPEIWFKFAFIKDCMNKFEESKIIYEKLIEKYPDSIGTILNLFKIYFDEGELKKAEDLLEKALMIDEQKSNIWNGVASLKEKQGKMKEFYEACQKSLKYSINNEEKKGALYNLGTYFKKTEDHPKAIEFYKESLAIDENFKLAFNGLIQSLLCMEEYNEIINKTKDVDNNLDNVIILRTKALAFSGIGKKDKAIEIIYDLIPLDKDDGELQSFLNNILGDIFKMQEDWKKAIEFYQKALNTIQESNDVNSEISEKIEDCKRKINSSKNNNS